jgi:hypothetical protein
MHFHFDFSAVQILWTLTFAALLVLLVILLGRDRARRFPWFTASIAVVALRLLVSRLLFERLPPMTLTIVFLALADLAVLMSLLVIVEMARRAFTGASRLAWIVGTLAVLAVAATAVGVWGPWPAWKTLTAGSTLAALRLMQLAAQKFELLADLLAVELGLLVVLLGRRFNAGWRSHVQQIVIGLSTVGITEVAMRAIWQQIATHAAPHSRVEYERVMGLQGKLYNANNAIYVAVLVWWIVCLWIDEPGANPSANPSANPEANADSEASAPIPAAATGSPENEPLTTDN